MQIARFFTHDGCAFDLPLQDGKTLPMIIQQVHVDGYVLTPEWYLPRDTLKYVVCFNAEVGGKVMPFFVVPTPDKPA